jgi:hypothetical protein
MNLVGEICVPLSERMWAVHAGSSDGPRLIFPFSRSDAVRVSEQESKILLCHLLETTPYFYSIETPTREIYMQSGTHGLSARVDVSIYGSRLASDRILNVELKSGTADLEAFRKDFEKLAREGVDGLWFHTLERADARTLKTLFTRMNEAMELISDDAVAVHHSLTIALCLLESQVLLTTEVRFGEAIASTMVEVLAHTSTSWTVSGPGAAAHGSVAIPPTPLRIASPQKSGPGSGPAGRTGGSREQYLVYCPEITDDSFLHFSREGDNYKLRAFVGRLAGRAPWKEPGAPTAGDFLRVFPSERSITVDNSGVSLEKKDKWAEIIAAHNRAAGIGA